MRYYIFYMKRRGVIAAVTMSVVPLTGCGDRLGRDSSTSTTESGDKTTNPTAAPSKRLIIKSTVEDAVELTIKLTELSSNNIVHDRKIEFSRGDEINFNNYFAPGEDYRLKIRRNDDVLFDKTIYDYEGYVLVLRTRNSIEIERHYES